MREIKFRAYNSKGIDEGKWLNFDLNHNHHTKNFTLSEWIHLPKVQFTGLHDKNGKEIYEGDVARDEAGKVIEIIWLSDGLYMPGFANNEIKKGPKILLTGEVEIIGNIYEHPDLLK